MYHQDKLITGYPRRIKFILALILLAISATAYLSPVFTTATDRGTVSLDVLVETFDIPPTQQFQAPPPPARPSIPVESDNLDLPEDITIAETVLEEFVDWELPPPPDDGPRVRFIAYDEPPQPIGGYQGIAEHLVYPPIALAAQLEATVIVQAFVNKDGIVTDALILEGIPNMGLNEAAEKAVRATRFKPAKQRDRNIGVWIAIPIVFSLTG
jgi:protein TonB